MGIATLIQIFNLVLPEVFGFINAQKAKTNPATGQPWTYSEILDNAGIQLDAEYARLLQDMANDIVEGAG